MRTVLRVKGSADKGHASDIDRVRGQGNPQGFTMPQSNPLEQVLEATVKANEAPEQEDEGQDQDEGQEAPEQEAQDDKQLNILLRKCENAFTKGNKGLLLSRVECGKWSHAVFFNRPARLHFSAGPAHEESA